MANTSSTPERALFTADPQAGYRAHAADIRAAIDRALASGRYILGPEVEAFEREFAGYVGGGEAIGVANGTDAIELALRAVGVQPSDLVATVANTVSATAAAIVAAGARATFVEIDPVTMTMSPAALEETLQRAAGRVKAVVPVHLYGNPADMPAIMAAARRYGARVVEDCAQSHGAKIDGRMTGTWGEAAAFSFYPTKNLGALGDAGAVFTGDRSLAEQVRLLRQYGWRERYVSDLPGGNSRLDELQAAILRAKLPHLEAENAHRQALAARYGAMLAGGPVRLPESTRGAEPVWHQYAVRTPQRDVLRAYLETRGIHAGVLYPVPLHRQRAYADATVALAETERACAEVLCLPLHPGVRIEDVDRVAGAIRDWERG